MISARAALLAAWLAMGVSIPGHAAEPASIATLDADFAVADLAAGTRIGAVQVDGAADPVEIFAERKDTRVLLTARSGATVIGKAESAVGLAITPIYVTVGSRLQRINVQWRQPREPVSATNPEGTDKLPSEGD